MKYIKCALQNTVRSMSGKMLAPEIRFGLIVRAVVLVLLLGGIKVAMMLTMSSHLFQTHYRLQGNLSGPVMIGTGCLFIGLLMASFIQLGRQSPVYAVRDIRWFNVWFVIAGLAFTFFSLHQGPNNYIQPVLDGTLRWQAVGWYLANNFFFGPPWLAVYCLAYPLAYWWLVSVGKEGWSFYLMGLIAAIYSILNLQELMLLGGALLVVNCIGIGALISLRFGRSLFSWRPAAVFILLSASGWFLFVPYLAGVGGCFILIATMSLAVWGSIYVLARRSTVFPVLIYFIPFYAAAFFLLSIHNFTLAENASHLLVYGLDLPHYFGQELVGILFLLGIGFTIARFAALPAKLLFDASGLLLVLVALADFQMARQMGFRLDWNAVTISNNPIMVWRTIRPFAGQYIFTLIGIIAAYYTLVNLAKRFIGKSSQLKKIVSGKPADALFLSVTFTLIVFISPILLGQSDKAAGTWLGNILETNPHASYSGLNAG